MSLPHRVPRALLLSTVAVIGAITFVVHYPCLQGKFLDWDDNAYVVKNFRAHELTFENAIWFFSHPYFNSYTPLALLSHSLDWALWEDAPRAHHAVNLALHVVNTLLVFWIGFLLIGRRLFKGKQETAAPVSGSSLLIGAACAALLFAVHPLRVESVAWVADRKDLLATLFSILSVLTYLFSRGASPDRPSRSWMVISVLLYAAALLSKILTVVLPALLLVLDFTVLRVEGERTRVRSLLLWKLPYLLPALVVGVLALHAVGTMPSPISVERVTWMQRIVFPFYLPWFYLQKLLIPSALSPMYLVQFSPAQAFAAVPILLLTILTILSARRGNPSPLGAWLCYLIILSPTAFYLSPWIQNFADRHTYLSTIPLFLLAGGGVARLYATSMATAQGRILRVALVGILIFLTGWYILLSHRQIPVWQNSISLWTKAVTVSPASAIACDNLGAAIAATGNWTDAAMVFRHAAALDPHLAKAWNNLAIVCENLGEPDSAEHFYRKAIAADPAYDESYILLGGALERAKRWREATALYQGALEKAPSQARLWAGLGHALLGLQRTDSAKSSFTKALALDGNCIEAYVGLGTVLEMEGKADEAEIEYARARALYPGSEPIQGSGR